MTLQTGPAFWSCVAYPECVWPREISPAWSLGICTYLMVNEPCKPSFILRHTYVVLYMCSEQMCTATSYVLLRMCSTQ